MCRKEKKKKNSNSNAILCNVGVDGCAKKVDVLGKYLYWRRHPSTAARRGQEI